MVKTPKTRHSKSQREPVTIELEPEAVSREIDADTKAQGEPQAAVELAETSEPLEAKGDEATASTDDNPSQAADRAVREPTGYDFSRAENNEPADNIFNRQADAASEPAPAGGRARRGSLGLLAAGIIGGVAALAGAGALQFAGILPAATGGGNPVPEAVQAEIAQMKQAIAGLENGGGSTDPEINSRVDALAQAIDQLKADTSGLQQAASASGTGDSANLQALETRLTDAEASITALRQQGEQPAESDVTALGEKLAGAESLARSADEAAKNADGRLNALEQTVGTLSGKVEAQAAQPKIALSIAASALKSAIDRGAPFAAELETFAAIAPQTAEIQSLRAYAGKGVPSRDDLLSESDAVVKAMIAAAKPVAEDAGFFDRLLNSAESLVSVRPIGAVAGAGVPETAARMEFALKSGNLDQALAEYASLPEPAKAAGSAFAEKIRARAEAERLVDQLVAGAMKA